MHDSEFVKHRLTRTYPFGEVPVPVCHSLQKNKDMDLSLCHTDL